MKTGNDARRERLAAALKENLKRRKARARARAQTPVQPGAEGAQPAAPKPAAPAPTPPGGAGEEMPAPRRDAATKRG